MVIKRDWWTVAEVCALLSAIIIIIILAHQHKATGVKTKQTTAATASYSVFIVLRKETAFLRCRAMDRR